MKCPVCEGDMWDNRPKKAAGEFSPKSPDFKCKDKTCSGVVWPPKNGRPKPGDSVPMDEPNAVKYTDVLNQPIAKPNGSMLDERQRAIIRQHSQSMALEVLKLKVTLNELHVEDLKPSKLKELADYFDNDVIGAAQ